MFPHPQINIVFRGNITVVDWETAMAPGTIINGVTGIPAFASTRVLEACKSGLRDTPYQFSARDDVESIAYQFS